MAFVYEQPRKLHQLSASTGDMAPGKYSLEDRYQAKEEYYAPFLSTCNREEKKKKFITPGPGTYSVNISTKNSSEWKEDAEILKYSKIKKPEHGFLSTMNRFKVQDRTIPGPGSYQQFRLDSSKSPQTLKSNRSMDILRANLDKTKSLRVPTIPAKENKNGYTMNDNNQLVIIEPGKEKIIPLDHTITEGIPYRMRNRLNYDLVAHRLLECTKQLVYKQFNQQKTQIKNQSSLVSPQKPLKRKLRKDTEPLPKFERLVLPGPGCYQPKAPNGKLKTVQKFQFFGSSSLRFQYQNKQNQLESPLPNPIFQKTTNYKNKKYKQSFAKGERGLNMHKQINPGPGTYLSAKFKYNQRKIVTSMEPRFHSSKTFSQTTQSTLYEQKPVIKQKIRPDIFNHYPPQKRQQQNIQLGPAAYDVSITDIAQEAMKKSSNAPFGSKNKRFINVKNDKFDIAYLSPDPIRRERNQNPFNASTRRFDYKNIEAVGPGAYEQKDPIVKDSFNIKFIKVET